MSDERLRDEVRALRRTGAFAPLPLGVALAVAAVLGVADGGEAWIAWVVLLAPGVPLWCVVVRDARRRDETVLGLGDDAARSYLRVQLDGLIARTRKVATAFLALPSFFLAAVYLTDDARYPARPLHAAQFVVVGAALVVSVVHRRFLVRPRLVRRRAELGAAPESPEPWLADAARRIAATQDESQAALFWHEVTGAKMRDADAAVRNLPEPPPTTAEAGAFSPAAAPQGLPEDAVRARIRALARRDLAAQGITLVILAALFVTQEWGKGGTWDSLATEPWRDLTFAQKAYAFIAGFTVLAAFAQRHLHAKALSGGASSVRAYHRREVERRLERVAKWSVAEKVFVGVAAFFAASAALEIAGGGERPGAGWPALAEAAVFGVWFVAIPFVTKRRRRPELERELAEISGAGEPPPIPPVA